MSDLFEFAKEKEVQLITSDVIYRIIEDYQKWQEEEESMFIIAVDPDFFDWFDFSDEPLIKDMIKPSEEYENYAKEYSLNLEIDNNQSYIPRLMEKKYSYKEL